MTFSRRPETGDNQDQRDAFREQAAAADVTVLHCRIPTELHRRLRHLMVDEGIQRHGPGDRLPGSGAAAERPLESGGGSPALRCGGAEEHRRRRSREASARPICRCRPGSKQRRRGVGIPRDGRSRRPGSV